MGDLQNNYIKFSETNNTDFVEYENIGLANLVISFIQPPEDILVFENINFSFIDSDYCELDANAKNDGATRKRQTPGLPKTIIQGFGRLAL